MPRATNAPASRKRRKRTLAKAKGFRGFRSTHFRYAKDAVRKAMTYSYRDRKVRKRTFRNLWVQRINAAARPLGITYSRLIEGLKFANIEIDRKVLSDIAIKDEAAFAALAEQAKAAIAKKQSEAKVAA
jgi:large subunit ribosomal protein L20